MPSYPNRYIKGDPDSTATGTALINIKDIRKYSSVTLYSGGWRYSGDDEIVHGSLYGVSSGHLQICAHGQDVKFRAGPNLAIPVGYRILGARRTIGSTPTNGYIKAFTPGFDSSTDGSPTDAEINAALVKVSKVNGIVTKGVTIPSGTEDTPADVEVSLSYGLIV